MSRFFTSGGQSTGALASATVLPMNIQDWFLLGLTGLGPCCLRDSQVSYNTTVQKHQLFGAKRSLWSTLTFLHDTEKTRALTRWIFVSKVMFLLFNMLSRLSQLFFQVANVFEFHDCSHHLQWFWRPSKIKSAIVFIVSHLFVMKWWDQMPWS